MKVDVIKSQPDDKACVESIRRGNSPCALVVRPGDPNVAKEDVMVVLQVHAPGAAVLERDIHYGHLAAILKMN